MGNVKLLKINRRESPFVQIDKKNISLNRKISWKAKGILTVLLGLKPDDDFNLSDLKLYSSDGEASTDTGIKELKEKGFLEVCRWRENNGLFGWGFNVHEIPLSIPVPKYNVIDNPKAGATALQPSKITEIAIKYNIDESVVLSILNDQKTALNSGPETETLNTIKDEQSEDFKVIISLDADFKALCLKEYSLTPSVFEELLTRFFAQKSILNGSKKYSDYEALKTHVFNWLRVHISKNKDLQPTVKPTPKTENTPPQYSKEKVIFEITHYKKMCDSVNHNSTYAYYKESVKSLLHWLEIAFKNGWLTDEQIDRFRELETKYKTAGELKTVFESTQAANSNGASNNKQTNSTELKEVNQKLKELFKDAGTQ